MGINVVGYYIVIAIVGFGLTIYLVIQRIKQKPVRQADHKKHLVEIDKNAKKIDQLLKDKFYYEAKPFKFHATGFVKNWRIKRMAKKSPDKVVLIRMEMNNGTHREFLVKDDAFGFIFNKGNYAFDLETKYYVVDSNLWAYDFHESMSISLKTGLKINPDFLKFIKDLEEDSKKSIKRKIDVNVIKETIEQSGITEVENSINPIVLERLIKSQIIQAILQGSALGRIFKIVLIMTIIILIAVFLDVIIDFIDSSLAAEIGLEIGGGGDE